MHLRVSQFLTLLTLISFSSSALPPSFKVCSRNSPTLAECIKNAIESLKPMLKNGQIAPGFVIDGIDPMLIGDIAIKQGFDLKLTGMQAFGISTFKIEKIRFNLEKFKLEMIVTLPKIRISSKYSLNWKIALLNIQGSGDSHANLENVKTLVKITGARYLKNGVEYIKVDDVKVEVKPAKIRVRFENLFNGQKQLEEIGNDVINQNLDLITNAVIPKVEKSIEKKILKAANQVFEKASTAELFP